MEQHPETPPGADRPGVRELLARLAVDTGPLRESRPFRWLWLGQSVSSVGSQIVGVAVPYQVHQLTGSTLAVGLISLVELVPLLTLTLIGGSLADAVDRRTMLLWTESGLLLTGVGFVVNASLAEPRVWPLSSARSSRAGPATSAARGWRCSSPPARGGRRSPRSASSTRSGRRSR